MFNKIGNWFATHFVLRTLIWNIISNKTPGRVIWAHTEMLFKYEINCRYMFYWSLHQIGSFRKIYHTCHIFPHTLPDFTLVCDFHGSINDLSYENVDIHITEFDFKKVTKKQRKSLNIFEFITIVIHKTCMIPNLKEEVQLPCKLLFNNAMCVASLNKKLEYTWQTQCL